MACSSSATTVPLFFFLLVAVVSATDHIVGANRGWNPGINYTLWANNHTFLVGDFICRSPQSIYIMCTFFFYLLLITLLVSAFRYQKNQYNVFEVNQTGYDNCTIEGATGNWSSGKDFILLTKAKRYFFICGTGGCFNGMKVTVVVHPLPSAAKNSTTKSSSEASAASFPLMGGGSLTLSTVLLVTWIWVVFEYGRVHYHQCVVIVQPVVENNSQVATSCLYSFI